MLFVSIIRQRKNRDVAVSTDLNTMSQRLKVKENNLRQAWIPVRRVSKVFKNAIIILVLYLLQTSNRLLRQSLSGLREETFW